MKCARITTKMYRILLWDNLILHLLKTLFVLFAEECSALEGITPELNQDLSDTLKPLMQNILVRYFSQSNSMCFITENKSNIMQFLPHMLPVFYILLEHISYVKDPEHSDIALNEEENLAKLLVTEINENCNLFIIHVVHPRRVIHSLGTAIRHSVSRNPKKYIILPTSDNSQLEDVFTLEDINIMPDLIVARFRNVTPVNLFGRYDDISRITYNRPQATSLASLSTHSLVVDIITHRFVGMEPEGEIVLNTWSTDSRNRGFLGHNNLFPDKTDNLEGKLVTLAALTYLPFVLIGEDGSQGGTEIKIFQEFAQKLNFTWKIVQDDHLWGEVWANGSGNGVIGK